NDLTPVYVSDRRSLFHTFANMILSRPVVLRSLLTNHHHLFRISLVLIGEVAAASNRNSHGAEVAGPNRAVDYIGPLIGWRIGNSFHGDSRRIAVVSERQVTCDSC